MPEVLYFSASYPIVIFEFLYLYSPNAFLGGVLMRAFAKANALRTARGACAPRAPLLYALLERAERGTFGRGAPFLAGAKPPRFYLYLLGLVIFKVGFIFFNY